MDYGTVRQAAGRRWGRHHDLPVNGAFNLKKKKLKPWQVRSWCIPKIKTIFLQRMEAILRLYQQPYNPKRPLVCFDEKSVQLLAHICQALSMKPGRAERQDYGYKRNGTRNLFLFVEPKAGKRCVLLTKRRQKEQFAQCMRYLVDVLYPEADCIDLVMDNLNTHHYHSLVEFFGKAEADRIWNRLCIHFTPAHGSWLNMAEIELSILSRQCLQRRLPDEWALQRQLLAWEQYSNDVERKIHWSFTVEDARRVFKEHYPAILEI